MRAAQLGRGGRRGTGWWMIVRRHSDHKSLCGRRAVVLLTCVVEAVSQIDVVVVFAGCGGGGGDTCSI